MVCSIAYNRPLTRMRTDLGLPAQCHGLRDECIKGYRAAPSDYAMGIPGAAIGYCQALFNRDGSSAVHTSRVIKLLEEIEAPWAHSHEMFWGYRQGEPPAAFIEQGVTPLRSDGRVPILITGLDPGRDSKALQQIVSSEPAIAPGETILVRVMLQDSASVDGAVRLLRMIHAGAATTHEMPKWWPLLQGALSIEEWSKLERDLRELWPYVNVAISPFTPQPLTDHLANQITVAQIPIGSADGVGSDGTIKLAPGMKISGAVEGAEYSLPAYMEMLQASLPVVPTLIILGPSQPDWTERMNQDRLAALLPHLRMACKILWRDLPKNRRDLIWRLSA